MFIRAKAGDREAASQIIDKHQAMVLWMAKRTTDTVLSLEDRLAECRYGLFRAIRSFDPMRGIKFTTYAVRAMWSQMRRTSDEFPLVGPASTQVYRLRRAKRRLEKQGEANDRHGLKLAMTYTDCDFSRMRSHSECVMERASIEEQKCVLDQMLAKLPPRDQEVLRRRFFGEETLKDIGDSMNITREAIRQIEAKALAKLRKMYAGAA